MQKYIIVTVYDKAISAYMRPFMAQTALQAIRSFEDEVMRPDSEMGKHPEDYALFKVAEFTDNDGTITPKEPTCLRRAHEIVKENNG